MGNIGTIKDKEGNIYHIFNGAHVECNGGSCIFCKSNVDEAFAAWEETVLFRMPPKGKRYKNKIKQRNRGKTISEICHTCKEIPCYICRRTKCDQWQSEENRKGQEQGCVHWENNRCTEFSCDFSIVTKLWR